MNKIKISGRLGRSPKLSLTRKGSSMSVISVACNDRAGSDTDYTVWVDVLLFDLLAEKVVQYLDKGAEVFVEGRLHMRRITNKEGVQRIKHEIIANRIEFKSAKTEESVLGDCAEPKEENVTAKNTVYH